MPDFDLIKSVVLSWQVIAVAVAFVLYWAIVSAIVRPHARKQAAPKRMKRVKRPAEKATLPKDVDASGLGLS
jgi:flagellar biosynthesis/type III secretory pathway M-ring protein FliF/YscJ